MTRQVLSILVAVLFSATAFAQNFQVQPFADQQAKQYRAIHKTSVVPNGNNEHVGSRCMQHEVTERLMERNPLYRQGMEEARRRGHIISAESESANRAAPPVYTIPIVFHVIHKGESVGSGTNISSAQIESTIDALNRDFRETSADGGIGQGAGPDTEIQFCLAGVDPQGNPHSGINRVNGTSVSGYSSSGINSASDADVKALINWEIRYYMNVWIVSEINNNGADLANPNQFGGGTLGYAILPNGTTPIQFYSDVDGIVVVNICIGNDPNGTQGFRLWPASLTNRTLTHEMGHYLGLGHTFSDNNPNSCVDGDNIGDTPNARQLAGAFNCNYSNTCTNQMITNYMDYTSEDCQNRFTEGQKSRKQIMVSSILPKNSLS